MIEQVLEKFPRRCPYCDAVLPDREEPEGPQEEREETCPHCGKTFIRVSPAWDTPETT